MDRLLFNLLVTGFVATCMCTLGLILIGYVFTNFTIMAGTL